MRLDLLLVHGGYCISRQEAQEAISKGKVLVNGVALTKQSKNIPEDSSLEILWSRQYVSRGGDKLAGILEAQFTSKDDLVTFLKDKRALDVGSSTGGFTDFLLQNGVKAVTCVDVGTNQMHESMRGNTKISLYENTDIRDFQDHQSYEIIVADLSFIPLKKVLATVLTFGKTGSFFILLIKPQFEVGKGNTKKGVVKDQTSVDKVLNEYKELILTSSGRDLSIEPCAIRGGDGNQEYFVTFCL